MAADLNGWVYAGDDAELVTKLLADPHRKHHILALTDSGWTLKHPLAERADGDLFVCPLAAHGNLMQEAWDDEGNPEARYVVELEGDAGSPSLHLERIDD